MSNGLCPFRGKKCVDICELRVAALTVDGKEVAWTCAFAAIATNLDKAVRTAMRIDMKAGE